MQSVPHFATIPTCRSISQIVPNPTLLNPRGSQEAAKHLLLTACISADMSLPLYDRESQSFFLHMSSPFKPPHLWLFWGGLNESSKHYVIVNKQSHVA